MLLTQSRYDLVSFLINTFLFLFLRKNRGSRILKRLTVAIYSFRYVAVVPKWKFVEQSELYHEKDTISAGFVKNRKSWAKPQAKPILR